MFIYFHWDSDRGTGDDSDSDAGGDLVIVTQGIEIITQFISVKNYGKNCQKNTKKPGNCNFGSIFLSK